MISLILAEKIFSLFIILLMGFAVVKLGALKTEQSMVISKLVTYTILPCIIISSFLVETTPEVIKGFGLSTICALILTLLPLLFFGLVRKPLHMSGIEIATIDYPNTGNLVIPIVASVMGPEYVIYTSPFMCIMIVFMWSHGKAIISGDKRLNAKKTLTNINMLAVLAGGLMMATGYRPPTPVAEAINSVGAATGPVVMLITGMLVAGMDIRKLKEYTRLPMVVFLRMIAVPLVFVLIFRQIAGLPFAQGQTEVMIIAVISASTPTASTITQIAQVYGKDAEYANVITIVETLLCIITIPVMVLLFQI